MILAEEFYNEYNDSSQRFWPQLKSMGEGMLLQHFEKVVEKTEFYKIGVDSPNLVVNNVIILNNIVNFVVQLNNKPR